MGLDIGVWWDQERQTPARYRSVYSSETGSEESNNDTTVVRQEGTGLSTLWARKPWGERDTWAAIQMQTAGIGVPRDVGMMEADYGEASWQGADRVLRALSTQLPRWQEETVICWVFPYEGTSWKD